MRGVKLCGHTKRDGRLCGAIAVKRQAYCEYHLEQQRRERRQSFGLRVLRGQQDFRGCQELLVRRWLKWFTNQTVGS